MRFIALIFSTLILFAIVGAGAVLAVFWHFGKDLPDYHQLAHYEPPVTTRVYAGDGRLVAEYAAEKRSFVPINALPQRVINAFLAAEDKNFYSHSGVDPMGILRAVLTNIKNRSEGSDRRPVGASTITQQVAKNFLLTNEPSLQRKIKEAILAFRIEQTFTKQHILELYLNEIYLGQGSYGVAAAALNYFDKGLDELTVAEVAFLGALPKAPNNYNPAHTQTAQAAKDRRDWVIGRMAEDGYITAAEARAAQAEPLVTRNRGEAVMVPGGEYFAEDIRREIVADFGEQALYRGGLSVRSTLDPTLQDIATRTLRAGLVAYDRRHGWRGPLTHMDSSAGWDKRLAAISRPDLVPWVLAVVLVNGEDHTEIGLADGRKGRIPLAEMRWARPTLAPLSLGPVPKRPADVLAPGDVIAVEAVAKSEDGKEHYGPETFALRQPPKVEGALVAIDPNTGRVLAMQGGFSYARSQFNRATQGMRQPGSSFKPFVYMTALDNGYTPSSLVLDAPIELDQGPGLPKWRPMNYHGGFLGPTTLRVGIEKSRNLMTVRLAATLGMEKVAGFAERFGVVDKLPRELSMALGAGETTPLRMAAAYAQIVNGGRKVTPTLVDRIQDRNGVTVYRHDGRTCDGCESTFYTNQDMPDIPDTREQLVDPMTAYQMVHILEGVVERGTGHAIAVVGKPLAGKTGTSNDSKDTWFVGFAPDLAVAVFVGFDEPASLGDKETGASVAAPVFRDFMMEALKDKPPTPFRVPPGIRLVRVNAATGRPASAGDKNSIYEAFKPDTGPAGGDEQVLENDNGVMGLGYSSVTGIGNLGTAEDQPGAVVAPPPTGVSVVPGDGAPGVSVEMGPGVAPPPPALPAAPAAPAAAPTAGGIY
jgi:penicillin-binding protein 1A